jgi:hypothetical protein
MYSANVSVRPWSQAHTPASTQSSDAIGKPDHGPKGYNPKWNSKLYQNSSVPHIGPTAEALHIRQFPTKSPGFMIAPEIYSINGNNIDGKLLHLDHISRHHTCEIYSLCR